VFGEDGGERWGGSILGGGYWGGFLAAPRGGELQLGGVSGVGGIDFLFLAAARRGSIRVGEDSGVGVVDFRDLVAGCFLSAPSSNSVGWGRFAFPLGDFVGKFLL
jgi:hypothetical protein